MLIFEDRKDANEVHVGPAAPDAPPPYDVAPETSDSSSQFGSSSSAQSRVPFLPRPVNIPSSNFVKISRQNTSVKGTFVIDAGLHVPDEILYATAPGSEGTGGTSADADGEKRKNLFLHSSNGSTTADVWLVDDESSGYRDPGMIGKRAELEVDSHNGSVKVTLETTTARPYALSAHSHNGSVTVAIPPNFVGPVTLTARNWSVSLSGSIQARLITFSEENGTRSCFIGDYRKAGYTGKQSWSGSTIDMGSHNGRVTLSYIGEENANPGFWKRIFG